MATAYSKIQRNFWETDEAREMTPEEKYFWMYLQTNANVNTLGCYAFRMRKAMDETGYNRETLEKLLQRMEQVLRILYDEGTKEVFLLHWAEGNWNKKTATLRALAADLKEIQSKTLKETVKTLLLKNGIFTEEVVEKAEKTAPSAQERNEKEQRGTTGNKRSGEGEMEKEREKEKRYIRANLPEFFLFWKEYPNKKNKQTAMARWDRMRVTAELYKKIMEGLKRAQRSREWAEQDGRYIPHPASWLHAGGWENEYRPLSPEKPTPPPGASCNDALASRRGLVGG